MNPNRADSQGTRLSRTRRGAWCGAVLIACAAAGCAQPSANRAAGADPVEPMTRTGSSAPIVAPRLPPVPPRVDSPIDPAAVAKARAEIAAAFDSADPVLRAQALEASVKTADDALGDRVAAAVRDRAEVVRFAGAMAAGDARLRSAYPALLPLVEDLDPSVQVATRYALHRLGDRRFSQELAGFSKHPSARVRSDTASVLGRLGERSAVAILRPMLGDAMPAVRIQAAEALWKLADMEGLETLVAGLISSYPDEQIVSTIALAYPKDMRVKDYLLGRLAEDKDGKQYVEVQLAAARALGMLGEDAGFGLARELAGKPVVRGALDSTQRQQAAVVQQTMAALALGEIGRPDALPALAPLLDAENAQVRLAAATAIVQLAQQ